MIKVTYFFLQVMELQADKSTTNTPTTPLGSNQGVNDSNEPPPCNSITECETNPNDTLNEGEKPGGKRKRYVAWNHFKQLIVNGQEKAECNYCQKKLGGSSKSDTKHLLDHFNVVQDEQLEIYDKASWLRSKRKLTVVLHISPTIPLVQKLQGKILRR